MARGGGHQCRLTVKGSLVTLTRYFDKKYEGRYFCIILKKLAENEPDSLFKILNKVDLQLSEAHKKALIGGEATVDLEWWFPNKSRRADLALYMQNDAPFLLIEIKVEDRLREGQLDDYISFASNSIRNSKKQQDDHTRFLLLSRYALPLEESEVLQRAIDDGLPARELRHGQLHHILDGCGNCITRMLLEYLEDCGMTYQKLDLNKDSEDTKAMIHMSVGILGTDRRGHGRFRGNSSY